MENLKQVLVVRVDLKMPKGKIGAQCAHASNMVLLQNAVLTQESAVIALTPELYGWLTGIFTKVAVKVFSEAELDEVHRKALDAGILTSMVIDKGLTCFDGVLTKTVVAVGPDTPEKIDPITGHLKLL